MGRQTKLERDYQAGFILRVYKEFDGSLVLKNNSAMIQGIPDLTIFYKRYWAMVEVKAKKPTRESDWEPNQEWYLDHIGKMTFTACVYPENEEEVIRGLQKAFRTRRAARVSQSQQLSLDSVLR